MAGEESGEQEDPEERPTTPGAIHLFGSRCCGAVFSADAVPGAIRDAAEVGVENADAYRTGFCPACGSKQPLMDEYELVPTRGMPSLNDFVGALKGEEDTR